ncbi:response regulator [Paenibacillus sp. KQZ6P-2]|uniref:Response regulator n=1 Tax=Paenibacillus mangrovi TaxID=2931978 RepID=A0A9X2B686_9BACL|nr:response regulator [Paenibacillus mangrovi]MCJ8013532.1 response regulator [Paenibacillus mangrovi]
MKILIVDDEISMRRHLKFMLQDVGFDIYEAGNGQEALQLLEDKPIDIMLTDIRMPVLDGIELIKEARVHFPKVWSIVLSNYAEFESAQLAMRYGAKNYVLKATVEKETLISELKMTYRERRVELEKINSLNSNEMKMLLNSLFHEGLYQHMNMNELRKRAEKLQIDFFQHEIPASYFAFLEIDQFFIWSQERFSGQTDLAVFSVMNIVSEKIKTYDVRNEIIHLANGKFVMLHIGERDASRHMEICKDIQQNLKAYLKLDASSLANYSFSSFEGLFAAIKAHIEDFDRLFYEDDAIILCQETTGTVRSDLDLYGFFQKIDSELTESFQSNQLYSWIESFFKLFIYLRRSPQVIKEDLRFLTAFLEKKGYMVTDELKRRIEKGQMNRLHQYKQLFHEWLQKLQLLGGQREEIIQALQYIHENYQQKISLDELSSAVHLSRSHLSKLFKDQLGVAVTEYVEAYRMKQARLLLRTTPLSIAEIGEQVGIPDIFYFSKMYKRFYQVNPSQDRNNRL